jgi:hypothetical protein
MDRLVEDSRELAKPVAVMNKLFLTLERQDAFADIDK